MQTDAVGMQTMMQARGLTVSAGGREVLRGLNFEVQRGEVLAIMGESGCGKSTLLRHLAGLQAPLAGQVLLDGQDLYDADDAWSAALRRRLGVMFQAGALWSSKTVGENLTLPLQLFTDLPRAAREEQARFRLALVGLDGAFNLMPAQLSGGMRKRAALARALALDPEILLLDEPGSGLDPINAARLDELVRNLRQHGGATVVMVTHDVASIFNVATRALYLDETERTMTAIGSPQHLLQHGPETVRQFLRHGAPA